MKHIIKILCYMLFFLNILSNYSHAYDEFYNYYDDVQNKYYRNFDYNLYVYENKEVIENFQNTSLYKLLKNVDEKVVKKTTSYQKTYNNKSFYVPKSMNIGLEPYNLNKLEFGGNVKYKKVVFRLYADSNGEVNLVFVIGL